jgi:hypothetical protein
MEITLKNKCCLYVIISIRFFSITICNLLIEFPSYIKGKKIICIQQCIDKSMTSVSQPDTLTAIQYLTAKLVLSIWKSPEICNAEFPKEFSNKTLLLFLFTLSEQLLVLLVLCDWSHNVAISLTFTVAAASSAVNRL